MGRYRDLFVKVRLRLRDDPRLYRMARKLAASQRFEAWTGAALPEAVVLALARDALIGVWQGALDFHADISPGSDDAELPGLCLDDLDGWGCPGIGEAMRAVGWADVREGVVVLPGYLRHNGVKAMDNALATERMRALRARKADSLRKRSPMFDNVRECSIEREGEREGEGESSPSLRSGERRAGAREGAPPPPAEPAPPPRKRKPRPNLTRDQAEACLSAFPELEPVRDLWGGYLDAIEAWPGRRLPSEGQARFRLRQAKKVLEGHGLAGLRATMERATAGNAERGPWDSFPDPQLNGAANGRHKPDEPRYAPRARSGKL